MLSSLFIKWIIFIYAFSTDMLVEFSFLILECLVLLLLLNPVLVPFESPSFTNIILLIFFSCMVSFLCCCLFSALSFHWVLVHIFPCFLWSFDFVFFKWPVKLHPETKGRQPCNVSNDNLVITYIIHIQIKLKQLYI